MINSLRLSVPLARSQNLFPSLFFPSSCPYSSLSACSPLWTDHISISSMSPNIPLQPSGRMLFVYHRRDVFCLTNLKSRPVNHVPLVHLFCLSSDLHQPTFAINSSVSSSVLSVSAFYHTLLPLSAPPQLDTCLLTAEPCLRSITLARLRMPHGSTSRPTTGLPGPSPLAV